MNNNKNRFAEDWEDGWAGNHNDLEEILGILGDDDDEPIIEEPNPKDDEIRSLYQNDHGLSYAVVYAHLFLIQQEEVIAPENDNWRFSFNPLLPSDALIKFYKTRRDSPQFVRARIRAVLDSISWSENSPKQTEEVLYKYLSLEMACRTFLGSLHSKELLPRFVEQCRANYEKLSELTKDLDRDTIAKGIAADIFTGVVEEKYVESPLGAANRTQTIQWVSSEIQECAKGKDNSRFLDRL